MKPIVVAMAIVLLIIVSAPSVRADLTPGQELAARELIKKFTAPEFAVRQQAVEKLIAMGPDVLPLIQKTLVETLRTTR